MSSAHSSAGQPVSSSVACGLAAATFVEADGHVDRPLVGRAAAARDAEAAAVERQRLGAVETRRQVAEGGVPQAQIDVDRRGRPRRSATTVSPKSSTSWGASTPSASATRRDRTSSGTAAHAQLARQRQHQRQAIAAPAREREGRGVAQIVARLDVVGDPADDRRRRALPAPPTPPASARTSAPPARRASRSPASPPARGSRATTATFRRAAR